MPDPWKISGKPSFVPNDWSSETQGQSVGSREKERRKFSSTGGKAPGYGLSSDHFRTVKRMLAPDWAQKCFVLLCPIGEQRLPEFFSCVRTRWLLSCHSCPVRSPKSAWFSSPHWKTLSSKGHFTLAILNNSDGVLAVNQNWLGKNVVGNCACHFSGRFYFF